MGELDQEQQDRAMELWIRTHLNSFSEVQLHQVSALLRIVDRSRVVDAGTETRPKEVAAEPSAGPYNEKRIAWELDRTALGEAFFGNALRVAKDIPHLTAEDREVLDRFATGAQTGTDHVKLQDIALSIRQGGDTEQLSLEEQLAQARQSAEFYKRRCELLQAWQSTMRDPERTLVCDVLANGQLLYGPDGQPCSQRYARPDQDGVQPANQANRPRHA